MVGSPLRYSDERIDKGHRPAPVVLQLRHITELDIIDGGLDYLLIKVTGTESSDLLEHEVTDFLKGLTLTRITYEKELTVIRTGIVHGVESAHFLSLYQVKVRKTRGTVGERATLVIKERILTDDDETATTDFEVEMNGEDSGVNLISRSVARGNSYQAYRSNIIGNAKCTGHSECDAILSENGRVDASPELVANNRDAALIHEAAIGKIAGEQILKLRTLGLTEEEAEKAIIDGFLK